MMYAVCLKKQKKYQESLTMLRYLQKCLEHMGADVSYYEDLYTRLGVMISSVLKKLGRYDESEQMVTTCMSLSLEKLHGRRIAHYMYTLVCTTIANSVDLPEEIRKQCKEVATQLYQQAYAATQMMNDYRGQQHMKDFCDILFKTI